MTQVIDISEHNHKYKKAVDWAAVKKSGVDAVMIRVGWAGYNGTIDYDEALTENIQKAHAAGLGVGLYIYVYCTTLAAATVAATEVIAFAKKFPGIINYPIAWDIEETKNTCLISQGKEQLTNLVSTLCETTAQLGYYSVWYTYAMFAKQYLDYATLNKKYDLWIAYYGKTQAGISNILGNVSYGMWQYIGDEGRCVGVQGACDRNYCYRDYPKIIKSAGLNGFTSSQAPVTPIEPNYKELYMKLKAKWDSLKKLFSEEDL